MKHQIRRLLFVVLGASATLLGAAGIAQARRVPAGFDGAPDPWTEAGCWAQLGPRVQLICLDDQPHFFQIPLIIDTATSISPTRVQGCNGSFQFGSVCSRGTTYNADGTFFTAQATNCSNGTISGSAISIPSGGTATVDSWQTSSQGLSCTYISTVSYTP